MSLGFSLASPPARVKDTRIEAKGKVSFAITPPPSAVSDNVTLTKYMQLPVEQYALIPMPMGARLTRLSDKNAVVSSTPGDAEVIEFELVVPNITFFKLSLQPVVYATVRARDNRVEILSQTCTLRGSPFIEKVNLNERFDICVNTTLTWEDSLAQINGARGDNQNGHPKVIEEGDSADCSITAATRINVEVDVPRPFSAVPKAISRRTGNAALKLSLKLIQGTFVDNLAKDYAKWATESEYRNYRASLSANGVVDDLLVETGKEV